ncbi:hypothetical protein CQA40_07200 [Helicobacter sp. MIT 01-3238]|nr:hypothetical protein CQA40_07200 [Helicobacter sp. MIT 01-3238]
MVFGGGDFARFISMFYHLQSLDFATTLKSLLNPTANILDRILRKFFIQTLKIFLLDFLQRDSNR